MEERGMYVKSYGSVVHPYPKIGRIFHLRNGLRKFSPRFWVEEKLDGFNARYFYDNGIKGITRGGFLCPYLNDRFDLVDERFFMDYPDYVLCGEVVGRANPYVRECHLDIDDVKFFVFDIMEGKRLLKPEERHEILSKYSMHEAPSFGEFSRNEIEKVVEIVKALQEKRREGIVVKDSRGKREHVKYTTPFSDLADISLASETMEVHAGYFLQRIMRIAFHDYEFSTNHLQEVGKAFKLVEMLHKVGRGEMIKERFNMNVNNPETANKFVGFLKERGVNARILGMERNGKLWKVSMERIFVKKYLELKRLVSGSAIYD